MATRVVMPKLTDTMEEGVVLAWKKREGDAVNSGDVLAEIETDKAVMDLEAFGSGTLRRILAGEGKTVKAGALIAVIAEFDEDIEPALAEIAGASPTAGPELDPARKEGEPSPAKPESPKLAPRPPQEPRMKVSPRAKAIAEERGIDLSTIQGTGPDGRITERDLPEAKPAAATRTSAAPADRPLSQMRKAMAKVMTQSKGPVPHFYLTTEIAMDEAERLRAQWRQTRRTHPSITDLIVKAAALALSRHPEVNVSFMKDKIRQHRTIDIGLAVGLEDGLITPVLRDCGARTLEQISTETHELIQRARNRHLKPDEYSGATFSISNLGMFEVENFNAVLVPPEAAALAVGMVRNVPVAESGAVKVCRRMKVTLSCDHRVLDGLHGAKFLAELKRILEHPLELVLPEEQR